MCGTFHSHGEEDDSDYSETDDEDEDDYEDDDDDEEEEEVKNAAPTFQNPEVSNQQTVPSKPGQCSDE